MSFAERLRRMLRLTRPPREIGRGGVASRTFVCGDVARFGEFTQRLGDERSLDAIQRVLQLVCGESAIRGGRDLELRGDGFLLAFRSPRAAICCAVAVQRALEIDREQHAEDAVHLRMAVHQGEVLRCAHRYFGHQLIVAFRLVEQAGPDEILVSRPLRPFVPHAWRYCLTVERSFLPRGLRDRVRYAGLEWARLLQDPSGFLGDRARPLTGERAGAVNPGGQRDGGPGRGRLPGTALLEEQA